MDLCQNGWPVVREHDLLTIINVAGIRLTVLKGPVADLFHWLADTYSRTVEPLNAKACGGWNVRKIGTGNTWSNHSGGTAIDLNWDKHPDNTPTSRTLTAEQISACHTIVSACAGVIRWGGDYKSDPDAMHWEIVGTSAEVAALVPKLKRKVETMSFMVEMPRLREGDSDARLQGYNLIKRMQQIIGATPDGVWGPQTTNALAAWNKIPPTQARVMDETLWRSTFGLAAPTK